ncbi:glycosyltransferase [Cohnella abietis]|uniref:Glycosyltransferase 2-like domain-containing protein n=1 Tax=Cohnella abietis TaxID=2507935 RepID=A0A3T1DDB2_9BACL|nr:glycosyltransferase [Cohnella abietis]BBI36136.1 hypothetical protein KCTCHS21_55350 [Cohnella abietis]
MLTSIVIATYNKLEYTQLCIESIRKYTERGSYEIIVVDNQSTDETVDWLKKQDDIKAIYNNQNLGFPKACNQGIEISAGDNILLLNNDTIVTSNWLTNLITALYSASNVGAVGSVTNNCSYLQTIPVNYSNMEEMQDFAHQINHSNPSSWEERLKLIGYCMLIRKSVVDQIGLLDERFTPGNYEDDDYSLRIRLEGYKLLLCKDTFIHHFGSVSFGEVEKSYYDLLNRNRGKFISKWGFHPDEAHHFEMDFVSSLEKPNDSYLRVLHIGSGLGGTLLRIKHEYPNAELYGHEMNESMVQLLNKSLDIKYVDINPSKADLLNNYFDYIYIQNPLVINIDSVSKMLKEDGTLITMYPHLLHYKVIKGMLTGGINRRELQALTLVEVEEIFQKTAFGHVEIVGVVEKTITDENKQFLSSLNQIKNMSISTVHEITHFYVKAKRLDKTAEMKSMVNYILTQTHTEFYLEKMLDYDEQIVINLIEENGGGQFVEILNFLAVQYLDQNNLQLALAYLKAAFEKDQGNSSTLFNLGLTMYRMEQFELALEWFELIPQKSPQVLHWMEQIRMEISIQV